MSSNNEVHDRPIDLNYGNEIISMAEEILESRISTGQLLGDSSTAAIYGRIILTGKSRTVFSVMMLDAENRCLNFDQLFKQGQALSYVDITYFCRKVLSDDRVTSVIVVHNQPSGLVKPTEYSDQITKDLVAACKIIGVKMLDHLIVCRSSKYYSYAEQTSFIE